MFSSHFSAKAGTPKTRHSRKTKVSFFIEDVRSKNEMRLSSSKTVSDLLSIKQAKNKFFARCLFRF
jgi:hypothetical protein